ncbi:MAG: hypothetical protein GY822_00225 [Deltaproteobacteria bacterium]|nr:hypothetical protein [Deltaproteobacteria bacterium]
MDYIALVTKVSEDKFIEVVSSAPRKIRETLFGRLGIKAKKRVGLKLHGKLEDRSRQLHARLKEGKSSEENDLCEELLRNWLFTKRPLLKATLDYLEVKNDDGLVDEEPAFFQELAEEKVAAMIEYLKGEGFAGEEIYVYLAFMSVPHLDDKLLAA